MKRNCLWEKIPVKIISIEKGPCFGGLRIEAVVESLQKGPDLGQIYSINWFYGASVKTSDGFYTNHFPEYFEWTYRYADVGMEVFLHHCGDDNNQYLYKH